MPIRSRSPGPRLLQRRSGNACRSRASFGRWSSAAVPALLSFFLQPDVGHLTLVDSSTGMLEVAERKIAAGSIDNMRTLGLDLATDPLPGERFGLIYSLMTAHHVPDTVRLLRDLHALLEAGGYLCLADLDAEDGSFHGDGFDGHRGFDRDHLGGLAAEAGFCEVSFPRCSHAAHGGVAAREYPIFLMVGRKGLIMAPALFLSILRRPAASLQCAIRALHLRAAARAAELVAVHPAGRRGLCGRTAQIAGARRRRLRVDPGETGARSLENHALNANFGVIDTPGGDP